MFGNIGTTEIIIIVFVILLLFGAKKIPELARGIGKGIKEFKSATKEIKSGVDDEKKELNKLISDEDTDTKKKNV
jgi:sec-independent protein translocase protein TatA